MSTAIYAHGMACCVQELARRLGRGKLLSSVVQKRSVARPAQGSQDAILVCACRAAEGASEHEELTAPVPGQARHELRSYMLHHLPSAKAQS